MSSRQANDTSTFFMLGLDDGNVINNLTVVDSRVLIV